MSDLLIFGFFCPLLFNLAASTGAGAYGTGYVKLLTIRGYDVCKTGSPSSVVSRSIVYPQLSLAGHITAPPTMLDDIQNSAEYISYAMESIYNVTRKPFPVQGSFIIAINVVYS